MNTITNTESNFTLLSKIHQASLLVGEIYAHFYQEQEEENPSVSEEDVEALFEMHRSLRRFLPKEHVSGKRLGSREAYRSTRG